MFSDFIFEMFALCGGNRFSIEIFFRRSNSPAITVIIGELYKLLKVRANYLIK